MIYWILLAVFGFLSLILKHDYKIRWISKRAISGKKIYIVLVTIILVTIAGLRSTRVGADTEMYRKLYGFIAGTDSLRNGYLLRSGVEIGYYILEFVVSRFFPFQIFLFITAAISIIPIMIVIYRYSRNMLLSLFFYITYGYFSFAMGGIRQACAIGICMIAFAFSREKKLIPFIITVAIATLFHISAVLFLPVYWLNSIQKKKTILFAYIAVLGLAFLLKNQIFTFLNLFSRQAFMAATDQGGTRLFATMIFAVAIGWFYYNRFFSQNMEFSDTNWELLLMFSISTIMWPIASVNAELNRMYYYYHIFIFLYLPNLMKSLKRSERMLIGMIFIAISCYYLQAYIINGELHYAPYYFFWE